MFLMWYVKSMSVTAQGERFTVARVRDRDETHTVTRTKGAGNTILWSCDCGSSTESISATNCIHALRAYFHFLNMSARVNQLRQQVRDNAAKLNQEPILYLPEQGREIKLLKEET